MHKPSPKLWWVVLIGAAALYLGFQLTGLSGGAAKTIQRFAKFNGDYQALKNSIDVNLAGHDVGKIVPAGSRLQTSFSPEDVNLDVIAFKYYLFPTEVEDQWPHQANRQRAERQKFSREDWDYFVDLHHIIVEPSPRWNRRVLSDHVTVYAKEGKTFTDLAAPAGRMDVQVVIFILLAVFTALMGRVILRVAMISPLLDRFWYWSTAYLTGFVVLTSLTWGYLLVGGHLEIVKLSVLWALAFAAAAFCSTKVKAGPIVVVEPSMVSTGQSEFMIRLVFILVVGLITCITIFTPVNVWDEMHIWLLKSKMFYYSGGLDFHYTVQTNNYYPLLWPLNIAAQYVFLGGVHDEIARWTAALIFICLMGQLKGGLVFLRIRGISHWVLLLIYVLVVQHWVFYTALTENLYIALLAAMAVMLIQYQNDPLKNRSFFWLALLMAFGVCCVKFEGAIVSALCGIAFVTVGLKRPRWWMGLLFCALVFLPAAWIAWLNSHQVTISIYHLGHAFSWHNLRLIGSMIPPFMAQPVCLIPFVLALIFYIKGFQGRSWNRQDVFLVCLSGGLIVFALSAGIGWPSEEIIAYYPEVLTRLLLRATPLLLLLWARRIWGEA